MPTDDRPLAKDEVECRKCQARYVPSFSRDYYGGKNGRGGLCESCMMAQAFAKPDPVNVTNESHLNNVCRLGKSHETCRYLTMLPGVFSCVKGSDLQSAIDERAAKMGAQGDNCSGPPDFQPSPPTP